MIPKKLHYCWFGKNKKPPLVTRCIESWQKYLPQYEVIEWNEDRLTEDLKIVWKYLEQKRWAFASDYMRLHILYQYGGLYLDTDIEVVKSFDPLLSLNAFVAYESRARITNGIAGSAPGVDYFLYCMQFMQERFCKNLPYLTSPEVCTAVYNKYKPDNVHVLPSHYFYPYNPYDKERDVSILMFSDIKEDTYAVHHWNKSWKLGLVERIIDKVKAVNCIWRF